MASQDFNSDDLEFDAPVSKRGTRYGQQSIEQIIENAASDRIESKRIVKQLEFGHGAPSTRKAQSLWVNRFEAFRQHTLKQDINRPYQGDDLVRFFAMILDKMRPVKGKPAPSEKTILEGIKTLVTYGQFRWNEKDGFKIDKQWSLRIKTWMDDAVKAGLLMRGRWYTKTWVGYVTLSRLIRAYLEHAIEHGVLSWDVVIARSFSLVLVASLNARAGDVAQSRGYSDQVCLKYRHIELFIDGDEAIFANLRATITVEFSKGFKDRANENFTHYLRPLNEAHTCHMCPIALLLVHALRHSLVEGTTLQQLLQHTFKRSDRKVVWLFPDRPVLSGITSRGVHCDLDRPAPAKQITETMRQMGLVAGMLDRAYSHALRLGAARDIAHLPAGSFDGVGMTSDNVRQGMGHAPQTAATGLTETYVGGSSAELYNARVNHPKINRREPRFASSNASRPFDLVRAPVPEEAIDAANELQPGIKRSTAIRVVRSDRLEEAKATLDAEPRNLLDATLLKPSPIPTPIMAQPRVPLAPKHVNSPLGLSRMSADAFQTPSSDVPLDASSPNSSRRDTPSTSNIDPALLDEDALAVMAGSIPAEAVDQLETILLPRASGIESDNAESFLFVDDGVQLDQLAAISSQSVASTELDAQIEETASILFGSGIDVDGTVDVSIMTPETWIMTYAKCNIVTGYRFAKIWSVHCKDTFQLPQGIDAAEVFGNHIDQGGSRDPPHPKVYACRTTGCPFKTVLADSLSTHETTCTEATAAQLLASAQAIAEQVAGAAATPRIQCMYPDCNFAPAPTTLDPHNSLANHIRNYHNFVPKPCEHGCEPGKVYNNGTTYTKHIKQAHSTRFPARCAFPGCTHEKAYPTTSSLKRHMAGAHKLADADMMPYLPPPEAKGTKRSAQASTEASSSKKGKTSMPQ